MVREENEEQPYYRNFVLQNEWLRGNVFDAMGNYLFCQECIDDGKIVRTWQCLLSEKYTNLRGIRGFHDFIFVKHPTTGSAIMKVRQFCHGGSFENTPMKVTKQDCVLPTPSHSYKFQDQLRALTEKKLKDLRHMYNHHFMA